jgi:hypothetical protein
MNDELNNTKESACHVADASGMPDVGRVPMM